MNWQDYIKPELLILIPVLYFVGEAIKKSKIKDTVIPFILGCVGSLLSAIYLFASTPVNGAQAIFTAIFTAITQGVLVAAASVYGNQILKQASKQKKEEEQKEKTELEKSESKGE